MSPPPIKLGLNVVWIAPAHLVRFARKAEELGFESVWSGEHVALRAHDGWSRGFPGDWSPEMIPFRPESVFLDPLIALAHVAAATSRIRLGVGIYMLALRDAVLVARSLASLDVLSNGRLELAAGLGWTEDEYEATGNEWKTRGRRMNEIIDALHVLFTREFPEFHGEFFDFGPIGFEPKPAQKPRPRIHIAGGGPPSIRRAATRGDGWYGGIASPDETEKTIAALKDELRKAGREGEPFEFSMISLGGNLPRDLLERYAEAGVDRIVVTPWEGQRVGEVGLEGLEVLERFAESVGLDKP